MSFFDFSDKKLLKKGTTSQCFILKTGDIFKQFNKPLSMSDVERFKYFLNYKNENFLFPFDFIYDDKKFYGYISKRALGQTLKESFSSSNLEKLFIDSIKLEKNIDYISQGKILTHDLHSENIIYDGNLIQIIDSDEYGIRESYSIDEIKNINYQYYRVLISYLCIKKMIKNNNSQYIIDRINSYVISEKKLVKL